MSIIQKQLLQRQLINRKVLKELCNQKVKEEQVVVLGGTAPHKQLINKLKARGFYTILVDYLENPTAKDAADEHIQISTLDKEKVLSLCLDKKVDYVISTCVDQANLTACYVSEKMGLKSLYNYETAIETTDKDLMKKKMDEFEIPTASYFTIKSGEALDIFNLEYPLVVKPVDSTSSKGVRIANNFKELENCIKHAISFSEKKTALVEEFIEGIELSIDCIVSNRKPKIICKRKKMKYVDEQLSIVNFGSTTAVELTDLAVERLENIVNKIVVAYDFVDTQFFLQAIVTKKDSVYVLEFHPRISGGLPFRTIFLKTGLDVLDIAINQYLEEPVLLEVSNNEREFLAIHLYASKGIFKNIEGLENLKKDGFIDEIYYNKKPGAVTTSLTANSNRVAGLIISGMDKVDLIEKWRCIQEQIDIIDNNGKSIFNKVVYKQLKSI